MAFNQVLADRVVRILASQPFVEKKMFGGVGYLINGNMACGVHGDLLIVRVGKQQYGELLAQPMVKPFDLTGKEMTGWVEITPAGTSSDDDLLKWILLGLEYARSLPVKQA